MRRVRRQSAAGLLGPAAAKRLSPTPELGRARAPTSVGAPAILARLLAGFPTRVLEEQPLRFQCRCSRERVDAAIVAMGRAELMDVLAHERRAEVVCEFCGARYVVEEGELRALVSGS